MKIRSYRGKIELETFFEEVRDFHGSLAPGVVLGGFMVDWALEIMEPSEILDAIAETRKCLPDAVQLLTKCSIGNSWLKILDWGKLAVTLYDPEDLSGARSYLDIKKLDQFPLVRAWAMKETSKKENPLDALIEEMTRAGRDMLTCSKVVVGKIPDRLLPYAHPRLCSKCGESFRYGMNDICAGCIEPYVRSA